MHHHGSTSKFTRTQKINDQAFDLDKFSLPMKRSSSTLPSTTAPQFKPRSSTTSSIGQEPTKLTPLQSPQKPHSTEAKKEQEEKTGITPYPEFLFKNDEAIRRFQATCHTLDEEEREGIKKWQGERKPNPGYQALGTWVYVDDEDGWVFRTIEQQLKKPTITEEEVTWAYSGSR
ncbi:7542_t:CDS:2, partial [Paraglomus occultum]